MAGYWKGKKLSEETKKKMSDAKKGRIFTDAHKGALSEAQKLVKKPWITEKWKNGTLTSHSITEETRRKLSEIGKAAFASGKRNATNGYVKWYSYLRTDGKEIRVQGSFELRACKILDYKKQNNKILDWEYTNDRYQYEIDNVTHTYLLDFKVIVNETNWFYLEIKGWIKPLDYIKWKSITDKGFEFKVWMEKELKQEEEIYNIQIPKRIRKKKKIR